MKKTFIVLLILAVAGGVFAQGWTFNGLVSSGIMLQIPDERLGGSDADIYVSPISKTEGVGSRFQLDANYANEAKTAGLMFLIRANGLNLSGDMSGKQKK